jgi:hypothetical protein
MIILYVHEDIDDVQYTIDRDRASFDLSFNTPPAHLTHNSCVVPASVPFCLLYAQARFNTCHVTCTIVYWFVMMTRV